MKHIAITLPLKIESVSNKRWHWAKLATYHKTRRLQAWAELRRVEFARLIGPVRVVITRIAPRKLDGHDNLRSGCKGLVDGIADWLGVPDNHPLIQWEYHQESGAPKHYAVRIEVIA